MKKVLVAVLTGTFLAYSFTSHAGNFNNFKEYYSMNWLEMEDPFTGEMEIRTTRPPTSQYVDLCSTVGCQTRTMVELSGEELAVAKQTLGAAKDAKAERRAMAKVIAFLELYACGRNRTCKDRPGVGGGRTGQLDCVDEATNTTSYMLWMELNGLLKHHRTTLPDWKGWHWFATFCSLEGNCFRMEADFNKTGQEPVIMRR